MVLQEGHYYKLIVQTLIKDLTYTCKILKINSASNSVEFKDKYGNIKNYNINFIREWEELTNENF